MPPPVTIVGMGVSPDDLTETQRTVIAGADILVGGRRLLEPFARLECRRWVIDRNLAALGDFLEAHLFDHAIVVLTSGDPFFFGIGAFLVRRLGADRVHTLPNVSAVAAAFARLGEPWQEVSVVSLHGRGHTGRLLRRLAEGDTVAVYTDPVHHPAWLAELLIENSPAHIQMIVAERLGYADEKITRTTAQQARSGTFSDPNLVILKPDPAPQNRPALFAGMPDHWFDHEKGLITKAEVRCMSLSRLRLFDRAVLWDLGAGSGSVSIEAGQFITRGEIFAVERRAERIRHIHSNRKRFGIGNLHVIQADLPAGLEDLPDPDRVFVGGGGRALPELIRLATARLKPRGIVVINTVLTANFHTAVQTLEALDFATDAVQIQVNHLCPMPFSHRLEAANPVWIVAGSRS